MIIIKQLLFQLLDEIQPNELLQIKFSHYNSVFLANKQSIFPLATEMRIQFPEDVDMVRAYRTAFHTEDSAREAKYIENHTVHLNDNEFVITEELLDVQYEDNYFVITISNTDGIYTEYFKYDHIVAIKKTNESHRAYLRDYNMLNYKYQSNKK